MKKILITFLFLFLVSCGNDTSKIWNEPVVDFTGSGFSMKIPSNWTSSGTIDSLPTPWQWEVVLWSVSPDKKYNFSNNILVLKEELPHAGSSAQYSQLNHKSTQKKYIDYKFVDSGSMIFSDNDEGRYYVFDGKYNTKTQKIRFIQTAKMCGTTVYLLHASVALGTPSDNYISLFRTFSCQ